MKKNTVIIASAIALAVFSAAISIYGASEQPQVQEGNPVISSPAAVDAVSSTEAYITIEKAIEIAQEDVKAFTQSEQTVVKSKLDYDDGIMEYDIKIIAGDVEYDYEINASTGVIIERDIEKIKSAKTKTTETAQKSETKSSSSKSSSNSNNSNNSKGSKDSKNIVFDESLYITEDKAKTIALEYAKIDSASAVFTECKLDREDGIIVYEIEFYANQMEYEFEIDASTGDVIEFEIDD